VGSTAGLDTMVANRNAVAIAKDLFHVCPREASTTTLHHLLNTFHCVTSWLDLCFDHQ